MAGRGAAAYFCRDLWQPGGRNEPRVHFAALMHPPGVYQGGGGWQAMYHRNVREAEELRTLMQAQERA